MGLVQIEDTELATLRGDRDRYKTSSDENAEKVRELSTKLEQTEATAKSEKERADKAEADKTALESKAQAATLKDKRLGELGQGFLAKLGDFTRERLSDQAAALSDEDWDTALKEKEELAGTKRDAKKEGEGDGKDTTASSETAAGSAFDGEEVASLNRRLGSAPAAPSGGVSAARQLARSFQSNRQPAKTAGDK